jgi:adenosylhomocysteine nucleosidase
MRVGVVSGLRRETECLAAAGVSSSDILTFAGVGREKATEGARRLLAEGAQALVSFGVCGGLAPHIRAGDLVLADAVVTADGRFETDRPWRAAIDGQVANAMAVVGGALLGVDAMIASVDAKKALYEATGAVACDMESHAVAAVAQEAGVPFAVLRAVSDPDTHDVPGWVLKCLTGDGGISYRRLLKAIARRPLAVPAVIKLGSNSKKAFGTLRGVGRLTGGDLGLARRL